MTEFFVMAAMAALIWALLWSEELTSPSSLRVWAIIGVVLAVVGRWFTLPYDNTEYARTLLVWCESFRSSGLGALAAEGCPYPLGVQYLLALFSLVEYPGLYLMKYVNFFGDILLAWACSRLTGEFTRKKVPCLAAFLLTLLLPSGIVLGGYAAMGESLWCALAVLSATQALSDRPWSAMALWALALCFGSGAVFLLPVFLVLLLRKRLRIHHLLLLPVVMAGAIVPVLWPDRPMRDILFLLPPFRGLEITTAFQGSPGLYALRGEPLPPLFGLGIFAILCLVLIWWLCLSGKRTKDETMVAALAFTAVASAMLLPWMGADSLYAAEALCLTICVVNRRMIPAAALCSATSLSAILKALFGKVLLPLHWGPMILLAVLGLLTYQMYHYADKGRKRSRR